MSISFRQFAVLTVSVIILVIAGMLYKINPLNELGDVPDLPQDMQTRIDRGQYLATAGNCASCHTVGQGGFMAGGLAFQTPFGTLYSTNITPDTKTGIGEWSDLDFLNSMRVGVRPNGEHLYPAFPYTSFTKMTDGDILSLYAYLQSIPAVEQRPPDNDLAFPFNIRSLMVFWKGMFLSPGEFEPVESESEQWNRGAYLVDALAHCSACHTPRNVIGAEKPSLLMSGGEYVDRVHSGEYKTWSAPNLTSASTGLALWSSQDLNQYLKTARNDFIESYGPMNEVIMNSTRYLEDHDISAMTTYLKSLPAVDEPVSAAPDEQLMGRGRTIYNLHCGTCHLPTGEGDSQMGPKLNLGSLVVQSANPASMINAILYSPQTPGLPLLPKWRNPMEEFQYDLDDNEVAAVATFIRHSWENSAGIVTPEQVAKQR